MINAKEDYSEEEYNASLQRINENIEEIKQHLLDDNMVVSKGSVINASSKSRKVVENVNSNYILSLAEMGAQTIGNIPADIATDEEYSKIISEINMTGVESAYAYLVSEDGTMIYHPTADKIGQPVENTVVKEVVSQLASGTVPEDAVVEYEFNGGIYRGFHFDFMPCSHFEVPDFHA
jgi:hypothetical protein